jgi:hypothetical protein
MKQLFVAIGYQTLDGSYPCYYMWITDTEAQEYSFCYPAKLWHLSPTMEERRKLLNGEFITRWGNILP